jgi:hypothetical protein
MPQNTLHFDGYEIKLKAVALPNGLWTADIEITDANGSLYKFDDRFPGRGFESPEIALGEARDYAMQEVKGLPKPKF